MEEPIVGQGIGRTPTPTFADVHCTLPFLGNRFPICQASKQIRRRNNASASEFLASDALADTECLILDVSMPGMSGPQLQSELGRRDPRIPIIFITAHCNLETFARIFSLEVPLSACSSRSPSTSYARPSIACSAPPEDFRRRQHAHSFSIGPGPGPAPESRTTSRIRSIDRYLRAMDAFLENLV